MAKQHSPQAWGKLKAAYRRGEGAVADLAPRFGISPGTALNRCAREKWVVQREAVVKEAATRAIEKDTETLATMLARHRSFANKLLRLGIERVEDAEADGKVSANLLDTMAGLLATAARQERLAAGIEPAKPVLAFEAAGAGAVLRVKRRRNAAVPEPGTA